MKNYIIRKTGVLLLVFFPFGLFAQDLELINTQIDYEGTTYPCIRVMLEAGTDQVKDAWDDFIKDKYDVKMRGYGFLANKDVLRAEKAEFKAISGKQLDFYTKVVENGDKTSMSVFASFGYDIHVGPESYPQEYAAMKNVLQSFLDQFIPNYYNGQISIVKDKLKDLEKEEDDMKKELKENEKEIKELSKRNEEIEQALKEKEREIDTAKDQLNHLQNTFKTVKASLDY